MAQPEAMPGFYASNEAIFVECPSSRLMDGNCLVELSPLDQWSLFCSTGCLGASKCADGYTGFLCGQCEDNYYKRAEECLVRGRGFGTDYDLLHPLLCILSILFTLYDIIWSISFSDAPTAMWATVAPSSSPLRCCPLPYHCHHLCCQLGRWRELVTACSYSGGYTVYSGMGKGTESSV